MRSSWLITLLTSVMSVTVGCSASVGSCGLKKFLYKGNCCDLCPPGTRILRFCNGTTETLCEKCKTSTSPKSWNNQTVCSQCPAGKYLDKGLDFCFPCKRCRKGLYPSQPCSRNTKCLKCPEGYYSDDPQNYNEKCQKLKQTTMETTHPKDTTTKTQPTTTFVPATTNESESTTKQKDDAVDDEKDLVMIILIIVVSLFSGCLFFGTIYACVKHPSIFRKGSSIVKFNREARYEKLSTGLLLRDQPATLFIRLHEMLNPDGPKNWKRLAAELKDFSYDDILNFETDRTTSCERMLISWKTKDCATVDKLHACLLKIGREDVANLVAETIQHSNRESFV